MDFQLIAGRPDTPDHLVFTTTIIFFTKRLLLKPFHGERHLTGTYDVLLQSDKGTQRLPRKR